MKRLIIVGLLSLAACNKQPDPAEQVVSSVADTLSPEEEANLTANSDAPTSNLTEAELDESSDNMMAQQAADQQESHLIDILNPETNDDRYVIRDIATGCEFIQIENDGYGSDTGRSLTVIPRPNGKGSQRGCGTGTDFTKAK